MNSFITGLSLRERITLAAGMVLFVMILIYVLLLTPFYENMERYRAEVPEKKKALAWMQDASRQIVRLRVAGGQRNGTAGDGTPLVVIDRTAKQLYLDQALIKVEPSGQNRVKVWLEEAVFDDIIQWFFILRDNGILVTTFTTERLDKPGHVNARITLAGS